MVDLRSQMTYASCSVGTSAGAFLRPTVLEPAQHIVEMNDWLRRFARERI